MPGKKTRAHNKIGQLDPVLVAEVDALLHAGVTYREIATHLQQLGYAISRSAVGRYGTQFLARQQRLKDVHTMASAIMHGNGGQTLLLEEATVRLILDQLFILLIAWDELDQPPDLFRLVEVVAKLQSANTQRAKWNDELRQRAERAAKAAERTATKRGLSVEDAAQIRQQILGIIPTGEAHGPG